MEVYVGFEPESQELFQKDVAKKSLLQTLIQY